MRKRAMGLIVAVISFPACAPSTSHHPAAPLPSPSRPEIAAKTTNTPARQWTFNFNNDARSYYSTSQTTLGSDSISSSDMGRDTISVDAWFTVAVDRSQAPAIIAGHIDSVMLRSGSKIGTGSRKITTLVDFSGIVDSSRLVLNTITTNPSTLTTQPGDNSCDGPAGSFLGEVRGGIILLPAQLQSGSTWADSLSTVTCSGNGITSILEIIRSYRIIGERAIGNTAALLIQRTERIRLTGNGAQGQHRVQLEGQGTGSTDITANSVTGTILLVEINQELRLAVFSSGQFNHFTQKVKQRITLTP